jgi:hypothetical protein
MTSCEVLLATGYFIDNEFLHKYCCIIDRHRVRKYVRGKTNRHHILPRAYFKITHQSVNNDPTNLVDLPYREHALCHYYLCLCTKDPLKYANELALMCLISRKKMSVVDKQLVESLPQYSQIYADYINKKRTGYQLYLEDINDN